jgi:hypothetical protein
MAFKTNSAGRKLYNKILTATGVVLARNVLYPNAVDDSPIIGDDGTVKYLAIDEQTVGDFDGEFYRSVTTEGPNQDGTAWEIVQSVEKRTPEEIKLAAQNREAFERSKKVPQQELSRLTVICLAAVLRQAKNLTLTEDEQAALDKLVVIAGAVTKDQANLQTKLDAIDAGQEPDLSAGWEKLAL